MASATSDTTKPSQDAGLETSLEEYKSRTFKSVRINQLSTSATNWLCRILYALDSKDVTTYTSFMADDVSITFNNGEMSMNGVQSVRDGLAQFWQSFGSIAHEELNIYGTDTQFVHEALNHYVTLDGRNVTVRAVAWIDRDRDQGKIVALRIYNDQSPLWKST